MSMRPTRIIVVIFFCYGKKQKHQGSNIIFFSLIRSFYFNNNTHLECINERCSFS